MNDKQPKTSWDLKSPNFHKGIPLSSEMGVSPLVSQLLLNRGIESSENADTYLNPTFDNLHDPFGLPNMGHAINRIKRAIRDNETICIYGDYDADGTTATALLINTFRYLGVVVDYHIPNRFEEGYGLNEDTIQRIHNEKGANLLITVDCGITAVDEVRLANALGIDVIITDHHQPEAEVPSAYAIVSPKIEGNEYPYEELAGVGLAFKIAQALVPDKRYQQSLLDLVALGTVVDVASLTGENRILSSLGLEEINKWRRPGMRALCIESGFIPGQTINSYALSFKLGPRINAAGRMESANIVVDLLTTTDNQKAARIAKSLNTLNKDRQSLESRIQSDAIHLIEQEDPHNLHGIVVGSDTWGQTAQGVVGIVAARIKEQYQKPTIVLSIQNGKGVGSGRCIPGINLADALVAGTDMLLTHGGHAASAGMSIAEENIPQFKEFFNNYVKENLETSVESGRIEVEFETRLTLLTLDAISEMSQLEPFGKDNPSPVFGVRGAKLIRGTASIIGKKKNHLKFYISDGVARRCVLWWQSADMYPILIQPDVTLDIAFTAEINEWNGERSVQLIAKDVKVNR